MLNEGIVMIFINTDKNNTMLCTSSETCMYVKYFK